VRVDIFHRDQHVLTGLASLGHAKRASLQANHDVAVSKRELRMIEDAVAFGA
jgi:hypothetical protein